MAGTRQTSHPPQGNIAEHERWMRAALAFGRRGMGRAAPNPAVGALVVRNGVVLGRGVTAPGGRPHAEPLALAQAGDGARGATLYVTLEPCSHYGRTPPCTRAIIESGVGTVVYGLDDPDVRVAGRGLAQLRAAGIAVVGPIAEAEARRDHLGHLLRVTVGRPAVTLKMAETADGFAAPAPGDGRLLITGAPANAAVHGLRLLHDAVMVGIGTALADDPQLTVRLPGAVGQPGRVVLDSHLRLPPRATLVQTLETAPLIVVTSDAADARRADALQQAGATVLRAPAGSDGLDLPLALKALGQHGLTRVFCEGGPTVAAALMEADLVDTLVLLTGPRALAAPGLPALDLPARSRLVDPACYSLVEDRMIGDDRLRAYERIR